MHLDLAAKNLSPPRMCGPMHQIKPRLSPPSPRCGDSKGRNPNRGVVAWDSASSGHEGSESNPTDEWRKGFERLADRCCPCEPFRGGARPLCFWKQYYFIPVWSILTRPLASPMSWVLPCLNRRHPESCRSTCRSCRRTVFDTRIHWLTYLGGQSGKSKIVICLINNYVSLKSIWPNLQNRGRNLKKHKRTWPMDKNHKCCHIMSISVHNMFIMVHVVHEIYRKHVKFPWTWNDMTCL